MTRLEAKVRLVKYTAHYVKPVDWIHINETYINRRKSIVQARKLLDTASTFKILNGSQSLRERLQKEQDRKLERSRAYLKSKGKKNLHK
jgi:hypothetical protein